MNRFIVILLIVLQVCLPNVENKYERPYGVFVDSITDSDEIERLLQEIAMASEFITTEKVFYKQSRWLRL